MLDNLLKYIMAMMITERKSGSGPKFTNSVLLFFSGAQIQRTVNVIRYPLSSCHQTKASQTHLPIPPSVYWTSVSDVRTAIHFFGGGCFSGAVCQTGHVDSEMSFFCWQLAVDRKTYSYGVLLTNHLFMPKEKSSEVKHFPFFFRLYEIRNVLVFVVGFESQVLNLWLRSVGGLLQEYPE